MLDMCNVSNSLIMCCYQQCLTMDPGSCGEASEDQGKHPIENRDREVVVEEPQTENVSSSVLY